MTQQSCALALADELEECLDINGSRSPDLHPTLTLRESGQKGPLAENGHHAQRAPVPVRGTLQVSF